MNFLDVTFISREDRDQWSLGNLMISTDVGPVWLGPPPSTGLYTPLGLSRLLALQVKRLQSERPEMTVEMNYLARLIGRIDQLPERSSIDIRPQGNHADVNYSI